MEKEKIINSAIDYGGSAAGATVGALVGSVAGPVGTIGGAIAGTLVEKTIVAVGAEISERVLSKGESARIGTVYELMKEKINQRLEQGDQLREDSFFWKEGERSDGEEILEGALLIAQKEYEERKLKLIANLSANIQFQQEISPRMADMLLKISHDLTYRQLIILTAIEKLQPREGTESLLYDKEYDVLTGYHMTSIATEVYDLYRRSLIHSPTVILDAGHINPSKLRLVGYGTALYELMELKSIQVDDVFLEIVRFLTGKMVTSQEEMLRAGELGVATWDDIDDATQRIASLESEVKEIPRFSVREEKNENGDFTLVLENSSQKESARIDSISRGEIERLAKEKAQQVLDENTTTEEEYNEAMDEIWNS